MVCFKFCLPGKIKVLCIETKWAGHAQGLLLYIGPIIIMYALRLKASLKVQWENLHLDASLYNNYTTNSFKQNLPCLKCAIYSLP